MVVTFFPATLDTGVTHDRVASPSTCTVHMPQTDMPQPYLVPLRLRMSRITHRSGMSAGASTVVALPFTVSLIGMTAPILPRPGARGESWYRIPGGRRSGLFSG